MKNSLEAKIDGVIRRLNRLYNKLSDDDKKYYGDDFKSIESSLKALEILKPYISLCERDIMSVRYYYICFTRNAYDTLFVEIPKGFYDLLSKELSK